MTQQEALSILQTGTNVFLTGEPGSGKTHTIRSYVTWLRQHGIEPALTASTGIAATHISGHTIHSWSGIGIRTNLSRDDLAQIAQKKRVAQQVRNSHALIIDEVSMLAAATLSMVDAVCREIKKDRRPFGGMQVVLVGDFFQLPPISRRGDSADESSQLIDTSTATAEFAFASPAWRELKLTVCYLSEQHRHEDPAFLGLLSAIRRGAVEASHRELLQTRFASVANGKVTQLYSHNADVNAINEGELAKLTGETKTFDMVSRGPRQIVESMKKNCLSPEVLRLKIGARVMFTKNDVATRRFVNGSAGVVIGFDDDSDYPIVKTTTGSVVTAEPMEWNLEEGGFVLASLAQIPLRLAWAITVHKSQGLSLDAAHMDLSHVFEYGQGYVALSRLRTLSGLSLAGINDQALLVHPDIRAKDVEFREQSLAAHKAFAKMPTAEHERLCQQFIQACGGSTDLLAVPRDRKKRKKERISTYDITKELALRGLSVAEIANERSLSEGTIVNHLERLVHKQLVDPMRDLMHLMRGCETAIKEVHQALRSTGAYPLKPVFDQLGGRVSYDMIRLARLFFDYSEMK
ncbi:MAG: AAA family ATPase [Candidatus Kerfeldbacteria bacterium]|nr:AAA family ATPase [Candidatus Kerfeldbacteria bacterium]